MRIPNLTAFAFLKNCQFAMFRFRIRHTGSVEIDGIPHCLSDTALHANDEDDEDDYESDVLALNHNTWSLRCHKEQLSRMLTNGQAQGSNSILFSPLECLIFTVIRLSPLSGPNKVGLKYLSACLYVRPSVHKKFLRFSLGKCIGISV